MPSVWKSQDGPTCVVFPLPVSPITTRMLDALTCSSSRSRADHMGRLCRSCCSRNLQVEKNNYQHKARVNLALHGSARADDIADGVARLFAALLGPGSARFGWRS